jgi:heterotetrameric sarcosine oxidase delta subunit
MMLIPCIHCGLRNASEFKYRGEARRRPDPNTATPAEWRSYLYEKANPEGWMLERWYHASGCRKHFLLERNSATNEIRSPRAPDAPPPEASAK